MNSIATKRRPAWKVAGKWHYENVEYQSGDYVTVVEFTVKGKSPVTKVSGHFPIGVNQDIQVNVTPELASKIYWDIVSGDGYCDADLTVILRMINEK